MDSYELGADGPVVSSVGLGCMGMSDFYGPTNEAESIATIHAAMDAGVTLLDTGDFYGMGRNELLIGKALRDRQRDSGFVQVKFGAQRDPRGAFIGHDASPAAVKTSLATPSRA
jgi:aryl-alcohol dehydrogenase-like predicted oxidoreductase